MYEEFFGFHARPFLAAPRPDRFFAGAAIDGARKSLSRVIERGEGAGLLVGAAGTGKTLLCQVLAQQFKARFCVALLAGGQLPTRQALLQAILYELGLPYRGMDEGELRLSLLDRLAPKAGGDDGLLLLVDEAHALSWRLLDEVRMFTNLVRDGVPRVRVVVAGNPILEERFASPKLSSFAQRLAARCYLEALNRGETAEYVRWQIVAVGGDPAQVWRDEALASVYQATDGIPRLINQVCDHALLLASLGGMRLVTSEAVEEAWADLQQLPAPWNPQRDRAAGPSDIVEFGGLGESSEDEPNAIPFRSERYQPLHVAAPDDQLEMIEQQLSSITSDFDEPSPAESTVSLDFPEFGDPFSERFDNEEVVFDRYGADEELFANAPRVSTWDSRPRSSAFAQPEIPSSKTPTAFPAPSAAPAPVQPAPLATGSAGALSWPKETRPAQAAASAAAEPRAASTTTREEARRAAPAPADERAPAVVEDASPAKAPSVARKMEYRQLFSKLRRG